MAEYIVNCFDTRTPELNAYCEKKWDKIGLRLYYTAYNKDMEQRNIFSPNSYMNYQEIERYLKNISRRFKSIEVDEKRLNGMPVIKNTRIPVSLIVACLKDEMTFGEICEEYKLTREEIETAMEYVIEILDAPYQEG